MEHYKRNASEILTSKELELREMIMAKLETTGKINKGESKSIMQIEKKVRICGQCGKDATEARLAIQTLESNPEIKIGFFGLCFTCELKEIIKEGDAGLLD